jgi:prevent-host-death family protein
MPATEAKNRFGELLETVHREPVEISKKGRTVAVMLSVDAYKEMLRKTLEESSPPRVEGILDWLDHHPPTNAPVDERDYARHLDEKYA